MDLLLLIFNSSILDSRFNWAEWTQFMLTLTPWFNFFLMHSYKNSILILKLHTLFNFAFSVSVFISRNLTRYFLFWVLNYWCCCSFFRKIIFIQYKKLNLIIRHILQLLFFRENMSKILWINWHFLIIQLTEINIIWPQQPRKYLPNLVMSNTSKMIFFWLFNASLAIQHPLFCSQ